MAAPKLVEATDKKRRAKRSDPLAAIAKRRATETARLVKMLDQVAKDRAALDVRAAAIRNALGMTESVDPVPFVTRHDGHQDVSTKCADCGATVADRRDEEGGCPSCHASPFEAAR